MWSPILYTIKAGSNITIKYTYCKFDSLWLIQKELNDIVTALGVVEKDKERPVDEPCPLLEGLQWGGDRLKRKNIQI